MTDTSTKNTTDPTGLSDVAAYNEFSFAANLTNLQGLAPETCATFQLPTSNSTTPYFYGMAGSSNNNAVLYLMSDGNSTSDPDTYTGGSEVGEMFVNGSTNTVTFELTTDFAQQNNNVTMNGDVEAWIDSANLDSNTSYTLPVTINGSTSGSKTQNIDITTTSTPCGSTCKPPSQLSKSGYQNSDLATGAVTIATGAYATVGTSVPITDTLTAPASGSAQSITKVDYLDAYDCVDTWGDAGYDASGTNGTACQNGVQVPSTPACAAVGATPVQTYTCDETTTAPNEFYRLSLGMDFTGPGPWADTATATSSGTNDTGTKTISVNQYQSSSGGGSTIGGGGGGNNDCTMGTPQVKVTDTATITNASGQTETTAQAGDTVTYTATVTNPTTNDETVTITPSGTGAGAAQTVTIKAGQSQTVTGTYTVQSGDVGNTLTNTVTATATNVGDTTNACGSTKASGSASVTAVPTTAAAGSACTMGTPKVSVTDSSAITNAAGATEAQAEAGDTITFSHVVTNTGTQPETIVVTTTTAGGTPVSRTITLAAGASQTVTTSETITAAQATSGTPITDNVSVSATYTSDTSTTCGTGTATNSISVPVTKACTMTHPSISVTETQTTSGPGAVGSKVGAGDTVHYKVTVKNTGSTTQKVTLKDVTTSGSKKVGGVTKTITLKPGQTVTVTVTHKVTARDVRHPTLHNGATVSYKSPCGSDQGGAGSKDLITKSAAVKAAVVGSVSRTFEIDTTRIKTAACAAAVNQSLSWPYFRYNALSWTYLTAAGRACFTESYQLITVTLPKSATAQQWIAAIDAHITKKGVGKVHTTKPLKKLGVGTTTIAWSVPSNGWALGRPAKDRAPHRYFARS